jgi:long-chain acyl-CoA synthetase
MNIVDEIFRRADPSAISLVEGDVSLTFGELRGRMDSAAASLIGSKGFPAHPRVAISIPNGIDHIVWSLAVLKAGGTLVPVPGELAMPERMKLVSTTAVHCLIATPGQPWSAETGEKEDLIDGAVLHGNFGHQPPFDEDRLNALNPALIRFSSGTTGRSKGVVLSHETLFARVTACNKGLKIGRDDRVLWILPMAHHFAVSIVLYLMHGATTVLAKSHLGEDLLRGLVQSEATVLYAAPFHYSLLGATPNAAPLPKLRLAVSTAAALPLGVAEKWLARYGMPLTQGMGIIEGGLPLLNVDHASEKPTSVGRPQPDFEVRIRDADENGVGEILLRGPGFFDAYLDPWQSRENVLEDGWLATGDLGVIDSDGCVTIAGRLKSVINVAGLKCFPEEIETVLNTHPDVKESRVYAHSHAETGSVPAAEIVLRDPENPPKNLKLITHCRGSLAAYKVPLKFTFVERLQRTASGKIRRA